jgi:hypothetical protein
MHIQGQLSGTSFEYFEHSDMIFTDGYANDT